MKLSMQTVTGLRKTQYIDKINKVCLLKLHAEGREFHKKEADKNKIKILVMV